MSHHHHSHSRPSASPEGGLTETEKILKLLHHWIHHNDDHAANYSEWARKVEALGFAEAARHLDAAARMTHSISREFEAAETAIHGQAQGD